MRHLPDAEREQLRCAVGRVDCQGEQAETPQVPFAQPFLDLLDHTMVTN